MSVRTVECSHCKGSGEAERWGEALVDPPVPLPNGDVLMRIRASDCAPEVMKAISLGDYPGVCAQWETVPCARCVGKGEYEVEFFTCKIF